MAKKKLAPKAARGARGGASAAKSGGKTNPFELKGSRRKFEVLGRREKAGKNNVIASREAAVAKRKQTLLVEYRQLRKANTFIDRRFGENDPRLDEEDRALARFQAQRVREARRGAKFALGGGGGGDDGDDGDDGGGGGGLGNSLGGGSSAAAAARLTHGGVPLDDLADLAGDAAALDELDDDALADLDARLRFGGGDDDEDGGDGGDGEGGGEARRKTRKEIMEEVIAKSKAYRAARQKQKEEDEAALDALDADFRALVGGASAKAGGLAAAAARAAAARGGAGPLAALLKPPGHDKGLKPAAAGADDAEYDRAARELVFEARGRAGERTLTPEELQERERARLEALERQRLKRMRGGGGDDDDGDAEGAGGGADGGGPVGGYAARRKRRQAEAAARAGGSDDDGSGGSDDDSDGSGSDGDGGDGGDGGDVTALDARRRARAAGDHPLQAAFREQAAALAAKYGVAVEGGESDEDGDDDDEGEEEGEEADSDDEGEEGSSGSGSDGESDGSGTETEEEEDEDEDDADDDEQPQAEQARRRSGADAGASKPLLPDGGPLDLPYTIPLPKTYEEFAALVRGRPAGELEEAVARIRAFNAAALAADSRRGAQTLYGILVQHFAMLAGEAPVPVASLDALTRMLLAATPEVPYYAATVARARLERIAGALTAALKDPAAAPRAGWPSARQLLQLRLFCLLFPVTDKRHPVVTPLALLLGKCLAQCPVPGPYEAALGLAVAGVAVQTAAAAKRVEPEAAAFVAAALSAFMPSSSNKQQQQQHEEAEGASVVVSLFAPNCLAFTSTAAAAAAEPAAAAAASSRSGKRKKDGAGAATAAAASALPPLQLYPLLSLPPRDPSCASDEFKLRVLGCLLATGRAVAAATVDACRPAAPALLAPIADAAAKLSNAAEAAPALPASARAAVAAFAAEVAEAVASAAAARAPLVQSARLTARAPKEYTPRFEEDGFHKKGDYDHDRARAERRKLERALVREKRGAMRELRRDAAFMAAARDADKAAVDAERLASERRFYAELQAQEADFKSGGQRGMHKGKKKK